MRLGVGVVVVTAAVVAFRLVGGGVPTPPPEAVVDSLQDASYARALAEARLLAAADSGVMAEATARFEEAFALRTTAPADAAERFEELAHRAPLGDWAAALAADARVRAGDPERAEEALEFLPPDLADAWAWKIRVPSLIAAGHPREASDTAREGLARARTAGDSATARWLAGRALLLDGDTSAARPWLRAAVTGPGDARGATDAAGALEGLEGGTDPADRLALVEHRIVRGELDQAARVLDRLAEDGAPDSLVAQGALTLASALIARGRSGDAERRASAAVARTSGPVAAELHLAVGRARLRSGPATPAREAFEAAVQAAPASAAAQEALYILADLDEDAGRASSASRRFARAADLDPGTEWGAEAAMRHGLLALSSGEVEVAVRRFDAYRAAHDSGWRAQQALYWAGVARQRVADSAGAISLLERVRAVEPVGYYARRAAERLDAAPHPLAALPDPPPDHPVETRLARGALARIALLERLGLADAAALERLRTADLLTARPGGLHALAEALGEEGRIIDAARAARDARRRLGRWDARLLRVVYPLPYAEAIERSAQELNLDPALVAALIRQESLFQPHAVSGAGAVGLMQVMPRTAADLARRAGVPPPTRAGLQDPSLNIRLGTLHLDDLLSSADGRVDQVLAIYNAGVGRVARWRELTPSDDRDAFLERIPYRETREYVRVVQENAALYRALYWPDDARADQP